MYSCKNRLICTSNLHHICIYERYLLLFAIFAIDKKILRRLGMIRMFGVISKMQEFEIADQLEDWPRS